MGKKQKVGKARKDKFYHLAKESGYRARSAFKLKQINSVHQFLEKATVCVDLCAAPGGWMQVAAEHMPLAKLIIGVDLNPIKAINGCMSFKEDITTESCVQTLKNVLHDRKVDVFLNDGAGNVGKNWHHDAFSQNQLTLSAMKLTAKFLKKGGWFITKVFRSRDYNKLLWTFKELFNKVVANKPEASRNESAEIFLICSGFKAPNNIDPAFFDPKFVFEDVDKDSEKANAINLIHPDKVNKKAYGYPKGSTTLHIKTSATTFITSEGNGREMLSKSSEIVLDDADILKHPKTTPEMVECCKDIKLLGKKELKALLTWRKVMKEYLEQLAKKEAAADNGEAKEEDMDAEEDGGSSSEEEGSETDEEGEVKELEEKIAALKDEKKKDMKRKQKKMHKTKKLLRDKMALNMVLPGDTIDQTDDLELFKLCKLSSKQALEKAEAQTMDDADDELVEDVDSEEELVRKTKQKYERFAEDLGTMTVDMGPETDSEESDDDDDDVAEEKDEEAADSADEDDDVAAVKNPLLAKIEEEDMEEEKNAAWEQWTKQEGSRINTDFELDGLVMPQKQEETSASEPPAKRQKTTKQKKTKATTPAEETIAAATTAAAADDSDDTDVEDELNKLMRSGYVKKHYVDDSGSDISDAEDDTDNDSDGEFDYKAASAAGAAAGAAADKAAAAAAKKGGKKRKHEDSDEEEGITRIDANGKERKFDAHGLAMAEKFLMTKKKQRELVDWSYNRYTFMDDNLPEWFMDYEKKHYRTALPISQDRINYYKERQKQIDARPIKKIVEAKARKQRKMTKKLDRARKKAEQVNDTVKISEKEKMSKMKDIYKRAGLTKKKEEKTTYVVAKRGSGRKVNRPTGIKGRFKVVDARQKKDDRQRKKTDRQKGKARKKGRN